MSQERFEFRSETKELLQLMAHSLYSSKDVFLRELVSNASDALDRRRFESLTDPEKLEEGVTLQIQIHADTAARTLTIEDNGDGMTREDLIQNLGTIAHSGTKAFVAKLKEAQTQDQANSLIGQFGVGFYSSFIVADHVTVTTRKIGQDKAWRFESSGDGSFTIDEAKKDSAGTQIVLHLRPEDDDNNLADFTDEYVIKSTIKKYSDFIQYPVMVQCEREQTKTDDDKDEAESETNEVIKELVWEQANSMKAIWLKDPGEVDDKEYNDFYKHITYDWSEPLLRVPVKAEGTIEYRGLLFIPANAPYDMNYRDAKFGLRLHAQHVLIMEQCAELLPDYLRFVKGVVDSPDLNLNLSREILQKDRSITTIRKHVTKKILDALENLAKTDEEKFAKFWKNYQRLIKEGAASDYDNKDRLMKLLRFVSTFTVAEDAGASAESSADDKAKTKASMTSFEAYVQRMPAEQDAIYAIAGESLEIVRNSPHLEAFAQKGYEVLYLIDAYDEILFSQVPEFDGKKIVFIGRGEVELGTDEEKKAKREKLEVQEKDYDALMTKLREALSSDIESVRLSSRLTTSPACLVGQDGDVSPHLHRILSKMGGGANMPAAKRILEINPNHPLLEKLLSKFSSDANDPVVSKYARLLFDQALLAEGSPLPDPVDYVKLVTELMVNSL